jgi:hypothetical protein
LNRITDVGELDKLAVIPFPLKLSLSGNFVAKAPFYRINTVYKFPTLTFLDDIIIDIREREEAEIKFRHPPNLEDAFLNAPADSELLLASPKLSMKTFQLTPNAIFHRGNIKERNNIVVPLKGVDSKKKGKSLEKKRETKPHSQVPSPHVGMDRRNFGTTRNGDRGTEKSFCAGKMHIWSIVITAHTDGFRTNIDRLPTQGSEKYVKRRGSKGRVPDLLRSPSQTRWHSPLDKRRSSSGEILLNGVGNSTTHGSR